MDGILIINKPQEFTSFDVVAVMRKLAGQKKVGHCGTLDPNATGVLPITLGSATKAQDIIPNHDKEYIADFRFGVRTDTLDVWGEQLEETQSAVTLQAVESSLKNFRGNIEQIPPMFSAIKVNGQKLCDLARQGKEIPREPRKVEIYSLELLSFDEKNQCGKLAVSCSKGTYIRSLISDIAESCDTLGIMTSLVRTSACGFSIDEAITLDEAKKISQQGTLEQYAKSVESLFLSFPSVILSQAQTVRYKNGGALDINRLRDLDGAENSTVYRVKAHDKDFLGLGIIKTNELCVYKNFKRI